MSLPERIRCYVLKGPTTGTIHKITFEAAEAVAFKGELFRRGIEIVIEDHVATRRPHATGEIEFRCLPCPSRHPISIEAVEGSSEIHDGCCDVATKRARAERHDLGLVEGPRDRCATECDFEDVEVEHETDEVPVSMNPFTDAIRTKAVVTEIVHQRCRNCGAEQLEVRPCLCEPEIPCRCRGECHC